MSTNLTAEAFVDLRVPSDPQVSPDGRHIAVTVGNASRHDKHPVASIWLARTDGFEPARQLTLGTADDSHPRWSPDGRELAFLSDRKERGKKQVHLLSLDGGEALPITDERGGVSDLCWLPGESRRIACLAVDARDEGEQKRRDEERDDANVYGAFWPFARVLLLNLDSDEQQRMDTGERHVASLSPSPDGVRLALTLWDTPEIDNVMATSQLATLNLETGNLRLIGERGFNADSVTWSADGRSLYFCGAGGETAVSSNQLWTVDLDLDTGPVCLSEGFGACVMRVTHPPDDATVLMLVAEGAESSIYRYNPADSSIEKLSHFAGDLRGISVSADGSVIGTAGSVPNQPFEVYAGNPGEELRRVTHLNSAIGAVEFGQQEVVHWDRAGYTLDGILLWPAGKSRADGPLPLIASLHGGPYGRWANAFISGPFGHWLAALGFVAFLPNPRGGMGHGQAFAESVLYSVGDEDYLDIMAGVDMLIEQGVADPDRMGVGGWSQGGFMTAWIAGHTNRFKAGVMGAGVSDWGMMIATSDIPTYENLMGGGNPYTSAGPHSFDKQSPISYVHNVTTPTLIVHGEQDMRVPLSQGVFFHRGLRAYDVPTELVTYPREPHGIQERNHQLDLLRRVADWYKRWVLVE